VSVPRYSEILLENHNIVPTPRVFTATTEDEQLGLNIDVWCEKTSVLRLQYPCGRQTDGWTLLANNSMHRTMHRHCTVTKEVTIMD